MLGGGVPDLPIIGAEAKQRAAARGCCGDTNQRNDVEMGVIIARSWPERERESDRSEMSTYANKRMNGERESEGVW